MSVFVSLFRGVNVGNCQIKMAELRVVYESLGFSDVQTYVQSGNVVFSARGTPARLSGKIREAVKAAFGHDVPVLVLPVDQLAHVAQANPFVATPSIDEAFLHVTFLIESPAKDFPSELPNAGAEDAAQVGNAVYVYCPNGYGRTKLNNSYFEKVLKVPATTRNWRTIQALIAMTIA
jgi:uncharacterized protein (DUF1697 family)